MGEFFSQLQEQLSRVWGNLNVQQKILFVSAPTVLILALVIAVYIASRPDFVLLVSVPPGEEQRLNEIATSLDASGVKYELRGGNSIYDPAHSGIAYVSPWREKICWARQADRASNCSIQPASA